MTCLRHFCGLLWHSYHLNTASLVLLSVVWNPENEIIYHRLHRQYSYKVIKWNSYSSLSTINHVRIIIEFSPLPIFVFTTYFTLETKIVIVFSELVALPYLLRRCNYSTVRLPYFFVSSESNLLSLSMLIVHRHAVGRQGQVILDLKSSAFDAKEKVWTKFPPEGSKYTPPHNSSDFRWKDYCPKVFRLVITPMIDTL